MPSQEWRKKNPIRSAYTTLKCNAKRRGKVFKLTFEEFKEFAIKTDYINRKGITATSYHIDRIDENKGYTVDNIQVLTNRDNVKKYFNHYYDEYTKTYCFRYRKEITVKQDETPF